MAGTIGITGVTGAVGGEVVRLLAGADMRLDLRLLARDPARAPDVDTDVRRCDYADPAGAREALRGVEVLLMVSGSESADRRAQHRSFVAAAADAGVRHVVYTSFQGAAPDATFTLARPPRHRAGAGGVGDGRDGAAGLLLPRRAAALR